ncbi:MAG: alkaline phosphatase family protein [Candidatus Brocadiaceae bacterium]|jgi:hypothetical protein
MKVVVVGIDGCSWRVLEPLLEQQRLPHIASLIEGGTRGDMLNLGQSESPVIWTTIATGRHPDEHRIFGFTGYYGSRWPLKGRHLPRVGSVPGFLRRVLLKTGIVCRSSVRSYQRGKKAFWTMASQADRTVGVVNWWVTHPPEPVNGFIVSDMANYWRLIIRSRSGIGSVEREAHLGVRDSVHPPQDPRTVTGWHALDEEELLSRARRFARIEGGDVESFREQKTFRRRNPLSVLKFCIYQDCFAINALKHMLAECEKQPDMTAVYLGGLDGVSHTFWKYAFPEDFGSVEADGLERYRNTLFGYYRWVDEVLGDLMELVDRDQTAVLLLSDHGFESAPHKEATQGISGAHENAPDGVFVLSGPGLRAGGRADARSIDIAPTVLHLLGLPVGRDMPGRVLGECLERAGPADQPVSYVDSWEGREGLAAPQPDRSVGEAADEQVVDRLKALGYMD